jgi:cysteine desulfurase/selenocysteine lyase
MDEVYRTTYANVHRGVYQFSDHATQLYDAARAKIARFIGAPTPENVVFTRNATEALNLLAYSYAPHALRAGDFDRAGASRQLCAVGHPGKTARLGD